MGEAEYILKHPLEDSTQEANTILGKLDDAISDMENIRSDNQKLREWGNDEYNRAEYAESERDEAETERDEAEAERYKAVKKCEDLEIETDNLKAQIEELQKQLSKVKRVQ
jgi:chromosome segregation ATPase